MRTLTNQLSVSLTDNHSSLKSSQSVLLDMSNLNKNDPKGSARKMQCKIGKKQPSLGTSDKQNIKEIDDGALRMISYNSMNRSLLEKNQVIKDQKGEITQLKQCLNDIQNNRQVINIREERQREKQLQHLRQLEKEYTWNLQEFQEMKKNMVQIREKYENVIREKNAIMKKYDSLLRENEELTQIIDALKRKISNDPSDLSQQTQMLKKQLELTRFEKEQSHEDYEKIREENSELQKRYELTVKNEQEMRHENREINGEVRELQKQVDDLHLLLEQKTTEERSISDKISSLQRQLQEGSKLLYSQNDSLNQQNATLSNLISNQEKAIKDLTSNNLSLDIELKEAIKKISIIEDERQEWQSERGKLEVSLKRVQDVEEEEKTYYRSKYQNSLQEYNKLSVQFRELQFQNNKLLKTNACNTIEIGNLKSQLLVLKRQIDHLLKEDTRSCSSFSDRSQHEIDQATIDVERYRIEGVELREELSRTKDQLIQAKSKLDIQGHKYQKLEEENEWLKEYVNIKGQNSQIPSDNRIRQEKTIEEKIKAMTQIRMQLEKQIQDLRFLNFNITQTHTNCLQLSVRHKSMTFSWQKMKQQIRQFWESDTMSNNQRRTMSILGEFIDERDMIIGELVMGENHLFSLLMDGQTFSK